MRDAAGAGTDLVDPDRSESVGTHRRDLVPAVVVVVLVVSAAAVPHLHVAALSPLVHHNAYGEHVLAGTAPLLGRWLPHLGWGTPLAVALAVATIAWGPRVADRLRWRPLVAAAWAGSLAWAVALALIDGWQRGVVDRMAAGRDFLGALPRVGSVGGLVRGFAAHVPGGHPGSWDIQTAGHPVGALLTFDLLRRIGLGGPTWAALVCVVVGTSAAAAVLLGVRAVADEATARRAAPFVVLAPTAVWIAVSFDALVAGVGAWGLALLALAATGTSRRPTVAALGAGLLLGTCLELDYGTSLLCLPAVAVLAAGHSRRSVVIAAAVTAVGVGVVVGGFAAAGFWWLDGLRLLRVRYSQGIAADRPYTYWVWADLAALCCATGLAPMVGLARALRPTALRTAPRAGRGLPLLLAGVAAAVVVADLSGLSKAETERIWLPFAVWLLAAPALLPARTHRGWLAAQALTALLLNSLLLTAW